MAIDPRLSLAVQGPRDINQTFQNALPEHTRDEYRDYAREGRAKIDKMM